ncbi:MAG: nitroreductase family protein [Alistipes sp.]|nr:nitroreductase family protein [Alistipes sp.]
MAHTFFEAITLRRTYYNIAKDENLDQQTIIDIIEKALLTTPSAFNVQSTRIVLLLGKHHTQLWEIVKQTIKPLVTPEQFLRTEAKINNDFAAGSGTILFFEDSDLIKLQKRTMPTYAAKFDEYSAQTSAMHQFVIWTMLKEKGYGASLQHYNPLIDTAVAQQWKIQPSWRLMAQMPFGIPLKEPAPKEQLKPIEERLLVFGE